MGMAKINPPRVRKSPEDLAALLAAGCRPRSVVGVHLRYDHGKVPLGADARPFSVRQIERDSSFVWLGKFACMMCAFV